MPKIAKRHELPTAYTWNLDSVYADENLWEADFQKVKQGIPTLASFRGTLGDSPSVLLACLKLRDETYQLTEQVFVYAQMRKDEDNTNNHYQALADRSVALASEVSSATAFVNPELLALSEEKLWDFLRAEPALELYRHQLEEVIRKRAHVRSAEVEMVLAQSTEVARVPDNTYTMLTNADIRFPSVADEEGRPVELTQSRYNQLRESRDRRVRQDAFQAIHGTYHQYRNTLATSLGGGVRADVFYARSRHYPSALEAALGPNNIPVAVYHNLIGTVNSQLPLLHRYISLRKRLLGLDELHHHDLYVPLVADLEMRVPYDEAVVTVQKALAPMGSEYLEALRRGIASRWVDVYENEGKTSGAHSTGAYTTNPFILLNYQDTLNDVFTLAHELGHSMHSYFTRRSQPYPYGDYTTFMAEVASTLNESLLSNHLIEQSKDPKARAYLVNQHLERFRTTLFRQTMFAEFELDIHTRAEAGEGLTPDLLSNVYRDLNARYYGPAVVDHQEIAIEWARIPHFYWGFYVYQYATGLSAATALAQQILTEGAPAVSRYLRFLKSGSSDYSINLLREAGVDMTSPEPIQQALNLFGRLLDQMEQIGQPS
ncbi:MAG: oligoendopeptidase F [Chloroflexota bacterium]